MSGEPLAAPISVPADLMKQVFQAARAAFPYECCGWLTGPKGGAKVDAIRPAANVQGTGTVEPDGPEGEGGLVPGRSAETAYTIAGRDLFEFNEQFSSDEPPRIIYHSHPNGRAYFSATDQRAACSPWGDGPSYDVQHLVVGIDADKVTEAAQFAWSDLAGAYVEIARFAGEDR